MKFDHIGIACEDINTLLNKLKKFMNIINISDIIYDELQDANLCMITLEDHTSIELISGNMVSNIVNKRQYLYHTCYKVNNIEEMINNLVNEGAMQISEIKPAKLFNGKRVVFLMWDLGLIELVEE
jgi:methylmalonyl-CoA/ethylmalonyl-CoA epimerase